MAILIKIVLATGQHRYRKDFFLLFWGMISGGGDFFYALRFPFAWIQFFFRLNQKLEGTISG